MSDTLWDRNVLTPGLRPGRHLSLQERFEEWLASADGRTALEEVLERAFLLRSRGFRHYGMKALWESIRYDRAVRLGPNAGFKINNDFTSRMTRHVVALHPELAEFFETRSLKA